MRKILLLILTIANVTCIYSQTNHHNSTKTAFTTTEPMVHDPVMAFEDGTYYLYSTGNGLQQMTSNDLQTWTVLREPLIKIPAWTHDSVPGFRSHVWAPDIIRWHDKWWLTYSCSTFGKNTSAIGLMSTSSLAKGNWTDEGCIVSSHGKRDNWNAIDPNLVIDDKDRPWLVFGSFWGGIQMVPLNADMHITSRADIRTIASRKENTHIPGDNPIEAPFIYKHNGYYYLFVSWDYCCRGKASTYKVAYGRSKNVEGPYLDITGKDMSKGGGTIIYEGDKVNYEAVGHCAVYDFAGNTYLFCHGYSIPKEGASILVKKIITWSKDGWISDSSTGVR